MQKKNSHYAKQAIDLLVKRVTIIDKTITLSLTTEGCLSLFGAADRNRTGTGITTRGILSPLRLPVPPPRQT